MRNIADADRGRRVTVRGSRCGGYRGTQKSQAMLVLHATRMLSASTIYALWVPLHASRWPSVHYSLVTPDRGWVSRRATLGEPLVKAGDLLHIKFGVMHVHRVTPKDLVVTPWLAGPGWGVGAFFSLLGQDYYVRKRTAKRFWLRPDREAFSARVALRAAVAGSDPGSPARADRLRLDRRQQFGRKGLPGHAGLRRGASPPLYPVGPGCGCSR